MITAIAYFAGVLTGAGLMIVHYHEVKRAVEAERAKYLRRIEALETERRTADCADAYRRGKREGVRM